jgi:hypothetical protein
MVHHIIYIIIYNNNKLNKLNPVTVFSHWRVVSGYYGFKIIVVTVAQRNYRTINYKITLAFAWILEF